MNNLIYFIAGGIGALCKDIFKDNKLVLPSLKGGELTLGFIGGVIIGGLAGIVTDNHWLTALMSGFTGSAILSNLPAVASIVRTEQTLSIEEIIKMVAIEESVDPDLALRVAKCESSLNPKARNINSPTSIDRGLFQINNFYHPQVTDEQADDPIFATRFFCKAFKNGNLNWWKASKACWDK